MAKRFEAKIGDIHAPVEDVEVPLSFKVLVVAMFFAIIGLGVAVAVSISLLPAG
ncbi:MAG: hypothetical protein JXB07_16480 [Anaerolineae bacterium]|nr:hypothetical protein [Anaerolineae bacterium]